MKPIKEERIFETFGDENLSKKEFKIKQSKEAFKILSSGVYSDKILAVIREYSTNAWDAHKVAGCPEKPFVVHLPNTFEPWFSVRDFGFGLCGKDIEELFTTYFSSSKTNSNDTTGMLGIGSKSAFAYTDQFTVTSWHNGTKSVYTCFISDEGTPEISFVDSFKSDEHSGLEIQFAVKNFDYQSFKEKAESCFYWYKTLPEIKGVSDFKKFPDDKWNTLPFITLSQNCKFYDKSNSSLFLVQGACGYPINANLVSDPVRQAFKRLKGVIEVPIGSVNITASREHLEYDKHTLNTLERIGLEIETIMTKDLEEEFKKVKTDWQCLEYIEKHRHNVFWYKMSTKKWKSAETGNETILSNMSEIKRTFSYIEKETETFSDGTKKTYDTTKYYGVIKDTDTRYLNSKSGKYEYYQGYTLYLRPRSLNTIVVIDQEMRRFKNKIAYNFKAGKVLLTDRYTVVIPTATALYTFEEALEQIKKDLDVVEGEHKNKIIFLSSLEDPPKIPSVKVQSKPIQILKFDGHSTYFREATIKPDEGKFYVNCVRFNSVEFSSNAALKNVVEKAVLADVFPTSEEIYGIPKTFENIPKKHSNWVNFKEYLLEKVNKEMSKINVKEEVEMDNERMFLANNQYEVEGLKYLISDCKVIKEFLDRRANYLDGSRNVFKPKRKEMYIIELSDILTGKSQSTLINSKTKSEQLCNKIRSMYPLIESFREYAIKDRLPSIRPYIKGQYLLNKW